MRQGVVTWDSKRLGESLRWQMSTGAAVVTITTTRATGKEVRETYFAFAGRDQAGDFVRLTKWSDGTAYTVRPGRCSCPDFEFRTGPKGEFCKHVLALNALVARHGAGAQEVGK